MMLKIAAAAGRLSGFPIPDMASLAEDAVNQMCKVVDSVLEKEAAALFAMALDTGAQKLSEARSNVEASMDKALPAEHILNARSVIELSADSIEELLQHQEPKWKSLTGLKLVRLALGSMMFHFDYVSPLHRISIKSSS